MWPGLMPNTTISLRYHIHFCFGVAFFIMWCLFCFYFFMKRGDVHHISLCLLDLSWHHYLFTFLSPFWCKLSIGLYKEFFKRILKIKGVWSQPNVSRCAMWVVLTVDFLRLHLVMTVSHSVVVCRSSWWLWWWEKTAALLLWDKMKLFL